MPNKKSFFERLAGTITVEDDDQIIDIENDDYEEVTIPQRKVATPRVVTQERRSPIREEEVYEEEEEGELSVDVYQTQSEIIIEAMVAGVKPEDLHLSITRDMVTIKGRREANSTVSDEDYFYKELYWGNFSRTILLPHEVVIEDAEAVEKHGLLIIRMPKVDKARQTKLKVKSI